MSSLSQEPVRLSFETENDSLNHSCDLVERGRRWLASQEAGLTEADLRVKLAIDLEWMTEDHFVQFDLSVSPRHVADENDWAGSAEHVESSAERNLNGNEVLVWISNGPKGVEDVISVAVGFGAAPRPERYEVRKEGGGKIGEALTLMSVPQGTPQVGLTLTEGKRAFLNTPIRLQHAGSGIGGLVERVPEVVDDPVPGFGEFVGSDDRQPNAESHYVSSIIKFLEIDARIFIEEGLLSRLKVRNISFRPSAKGFWPGKVRCAFHSVFPK